MYSVIDFHSHILPGIDDGSASVAESIAMLRAETVDELFEIMESIRPLVKEAGEA